MKIRKRGRGGEYISLKRNVSASEVLEADYKCRVMWESLPKKQKEIKNIEGEIVDIAGIFRL